jgi:copper(I)-binding protein
MKLQRLLPVFLISLAMAVTPACARECTPQVKEGWLRLPPGPMPMLAGFGRIENTCGTPVVVTGARSEAFGDVSLHETRIVDGISRMRAVPQLMVPAGQAAVLKPGGLHLMLMEPRAMPEAGGKVGVEFQLQDGRSIRGEFDVRATGG